MLNFTYVKPNPHSSIGHLLYSCFLCTDNTPTNFSKNYPQPPYHAPFQITQSTYKYI